jgi:hypothetical protein
MPAEADEIVRSIGLELVSRLAPEELPLYPALASQFEGQNGGRGKALSDDQLLGFGGGEAVALLTPVILAFSRDCWQALLVGTAETAVHAVVAHLQALRPGRRPGQQNPPMLTAEQLQQVRAVAEQQARRLKISRAQAGLLADAMVGVLAAPPVS